MADPSKMRRTCSLQHLRFPGTQRCRGLRFWLLLITTWCAIGEVLQLRLCSATQTRKGSGGQQKWWTRLSFRRPNRNSLPEDEALLLQGQRSTGASTSQENSRATTPSQSLSGREESLSEVSTWEGSRGTLNRSQSSSDAGSRSSETTPLISRPTGGATATGYHTEPMRRRSSSTETQRTLIGSRTKYRGLELPKKAQQKGVTNIILRPYGDPLASSWTIIEKPNSLKVILLITCSLVKRSDLTESCVDRALRYRGELGVSEPIVVQGPEPIRQLLGDPLLRRLGEDVVVFDECQAKGPFDRSSASCLGDNELLYDPGVAQERYNKVSYTGLSIGIREAQLVACFDRTVIEISNSLEVQNAEFLPASETVNLDENWPVFVVFDTREMYMVSQPPSGEIKLERGRDRDVLRKAFLREGLSGLTPHLEKREIQSIEIVRASSAPIFNLKVWCGEKIKVLKLDKKDRANIRFTKRSVLQAYRPLRYMRPKVVAVHLRAATVVGFAKGNKTLTTETVKVREEEIQSEGSKKVARKVTCYFVLRSDKDIKECAAAAMRGIDLKTTDVYVSGLEKDRKLNMEMMSLFTLAANQQPGKDVFDDEFTVPFVRFNYLLHRIEPDPLSPGYWDASGKKINRTSSLSAWRSFDFMESNTFMRVNDQTCLGTLSLTFKTEEWELNTFPGLLPEWVTKKDEEIELIWDMVSLTVRVLEDAGKVTKGSRRRAKKEVTWKTPLIERYMLKKQEGAGDAVCLCRNTRLWIDSKNIDIERVSATVKTNVLSETQVFEKMYHELIEWKGEEPYMLRNGEQLREESDA